MVCKFDCLVLVVKLQVSRYLRGGVGMSLVDWSEEDGYGSGDGSGYGFGSGSGHGHGYGPGCGDGSGEGCGWGSGSGCGDGSGDASTEVMIIDQNSDCLPFLIGAILTEEGQRYLETKLRS